MTLIWQGLCAYGCIQDPINIKCIKKGLNWELVLMTKSEFALESLEIIDLSRIGGNCKIGHVFIVFGDNTAVF